MRQYDDYLGAVYAHLKHAHTLMEAWNPPPLRTFDTPEWAAVEVLKIDKFFNLSMDNDEHLMEVRIVVGVIDALLSAAALVKEVLV